MAADRQTFLVIACETTMPTLWRAVGALRAQLPVARVHWHPDTRYADGLHFLIEIPVLLLDNPLTAEARARSILSEQGVFVA